MKRFCGVRGVSIRRWTDFWRNKFLLFLEEAIVGHKQSFCKKVEK
jgi:hypothetical protein